MYLVILNVDTPEMRALLRTYVYPLYGSDCLKDALKQPVEPVGANQKFAS